MNFYKETERLVLRDFLPSDAENILNLDSNADVHRFLGNKTISTREEAERVVENVRDQYRQYGIGRWIVLEKHTGNFIGWSGLKFITSTENNRTHFHDIGYRLLPEYWGRGYATESAKAALEFGFMKMDLAEIIGMCHEENKASRRALEKCGLTFVETFIHFDLPCHWLQINRNEWIDKNRYVVKADS